MTFPGAKCDCIKKPLNGELLITIMSSLAQEESRSISENVTWGQRKRFADGKVSMPYKRFITSVQKRRPLTVAFSFQLCARAQNGRGGGVVIQSLPRLRLCYAVVMLTGGGFPFHFIHFFSTCSAFPPPATLPS